MSISAFRLSVAAALAACLVSAAAARAADLGGDCCADLEERVAELEATTARKGNRKVSLTIQGQVHQAMLFWDDGFENNAYVVGNRNDQSNFAFTGEAEIGPGWSAGYDITIRLRDNLSDAVDQTTGDDPDPTAFTIWQSHWWIQNKTLGKISLGQASRGTDTVPERDLSEAAPAAYAGVQDIGGAFILRRSSDNGLSEVTWGDLINHLNGDTANVVRYDTPEIMGFIATVSWGEDDIWDVALAWAGEGGGFKAEAAIGYSEVTDTDGFFADVDHRTILGSVSVLHEPSGLNLTVAAGHREFDAPRPALDGVPVLANDGVVRAQEDAKYIYVKPGWIAKLTSLGPTAFYGEYAKFTDFLSSNADDVTVASLSTNGFSCAAGGAPCRVTGSEAEVWGLGVVQHIEAAEMQVYIGYRNYSADFDLVDGSGSSTPSAAIEDFDTIITGSKIAF